MENLEKNKGSSFEELINYFSENEKKYTDFEYPKVTVVIPTYNCSQIISLTIEATLSQKYPDFEVIVIDAGSTDRTLEVVKGYKDSRLKSYVVSGYQRYEMLNKGITQATGEYINFLFPGDFYTQTGALKSIMAVALKYQKPHLIFCGTLLRAGNNDVKVMFRHLSLRTLTKGQQPTSLQSCWFNAETFRRIGKFDNSYRMRGGFELLCRYSLHQGLRTKSLHRIFIDYDLRHINSTMVLCHFNETLRTIYKYFGFFAAVKWLFIQKDFTRFIKLWLKGLRLAIIGK